MGERFIAITTNIVAGDYFDCYNGNDGRSPYVFLLNTNARDGDKTLYSSSGNKRLRFVSREAWLPYISKPGDYNPKIAGTGLEIVKDENSLSLRTNEDNYSWVYCDGLLYEFGYTASVFSASSSFKYQGRYNYNNGTANIKINTNTITLYKRVCVPNNQLYGSVTVQSSLSNTSGDGVYWNYSGDIVYTAEAFENYAFVYFYNKQEDKKIYESTLTIKQEDFTDYDIEAKFSPIYSVVFDSNGGKGSMPSQSFIYEESKELILNTFTREGYVFTGWNTSPDGLGDNIENGADGSTLSTVGGDKVILYAQWRLPNVVIVKTSVDSGDASATGVGRIEVYSSKNSFTTPVVSGYDDRVYYEAIIGERLRVLCVLENKDFSWKALGVKYGGEYISEYEFEKNDGNVEILYYFKLKPFYVISFECTPEGNTASVTSPTTPDKDGKYVEGRIITVTGNPAPGYKLKAANVFNADKNLSIGDFDDIENNSFTIDGGITCNLRIACAFIKIDYDISASIDEKSDGAISGVTAMIGNLNVVTATYGDVVTLKADLTDNYKFGGWYANNVLISDANPYKYTVDGHINLVAKAKVSVNLAIEHINNREDIEPIDSCSLVVNETNVGTSYSLDVVLGESFSYVLLLGTLTADTSETWKFNAWFSGETVLPYRKEDAITPTENFSMTARVTSAPIERIFSVSFVNEETLGTINVTDNAIEISPVPKSKVIDGSTVTFVFDETQEIQLTFADEIAANESLAFSKVVIGGIEIIDSVFTYLLNSNLTATAYYGSEGKRKISIDFSTGSDRTMGEIIIDGKTSATESMPISIEKNRGEEVVIAAQSKNGYKFVGWYINTIGIGDPYIKDAVTTLKVTTNRTLFAKFVQDLKAVYEWEGSYENKMMVWRSKTYESTKPFNPSACRVDTTGYPLWSLSVEMFSAPDAAPTAVATLKNVRSQDARRLPIRRMERYMQVVLENNNEVDAVFVGTSMGGLTV